MPHSIDDRANIKLSDQQLSDRQFFGKAVWLFFAKLKEVFATAQADTKHHI